jgi:hypothetical protein
MDTEDYFHRETECVPSELRGEEIHTNVAVIFASY